MTELDGIEFDGIITGNISGNVMTLTGVADFLDEDSYSIFGLNTVLQPKCTNVLSRYWKELKPTPDCEQRFIADFSIDDLMDCGVTFSQTDSKIIADGSLFFAAVNCVTNLVQYQRIFTFHAEWDLFTQQATMIGIQASSIIVVPINKYNLSVLLYVDASHTILAGTAALDTDNFLVIGQRVYMWAKVQGTSKTIRVVVTHVYVTDDYVPSEVSEAMVVMQNGSFKRPEARREPEAHNLEDGISWPASNCHQPFCMKFVHTTVEVRTNEISGGLLQDGGVQLNIVTQIGYKGNCLYCGSSYGTVLKTQRCFL